MGLSMNIHGCPLMIYRSMDIRGYPWFPWTSICLIGKTIDGNHFLGGNKKMEETSLKKNKYRQFKTLSFHRPTATIRNWPAMVERTKFNVKVGPDID